MASLKRNEKEPLHLLHDLPPEIITRIVEFLPVPDFNTFRSLNWATRRFVSSNTAFKQWRSLCDHFETYQLRASAVEKMELLLRHADLFSILPMKYVVENVKILPSILQQYDDLFAEKNFSYGLFLLEEDLAHFPLHNLVACTILSRQAYDGAPNMSVYPPNLRSFCAKNVDLSAWEAAEFASLKLPNLEELELSECELQRINGEWLSPSLKTLILEQNRLQSIRNLDRLPKLQKLDISCNDFEVVDASTWPTTLLSLNVYACSEEVLHIERLTNLKEFHGPSFCRVPDSVRVLDLHLTQNFPLDLALPAFLEELSLSTSEQSYLPIVLPTLRRLHTLTLSTAFVNVSAATLPPNLKILSIERDDPILSPVRLNPHRLQVQGERLRSLNFSDAISLVATYPPSLVSLEIQESEQRTSRRYAMPPGMTHLAIRNANKAVLNQMKFGTHLQTLDVTSMKLTSIDGLTFPQTLQHLDLSENKIVRFDDANLPLGLISLRMKQNGVVFLPDLSRHASLKLLDVSRNEICSLDGSHLPASLAKLDLWFNHITTVHGDFTHLTKLYQIDLGFNKIQSLVSFHLPPCLAILRIDDNSLISLKGLVLPSTMTTLKVGSNAFTSFDHPDLNEGLEILDLSSARIAHFSDLRLPSTLRHLNLASAKIESLNGIQVGPKVNVTTENAKFDRFSTSL